MYFEDHFRLYRKEDLQQKLFLKKLLLKTFIVDLNFLKLKNNEEIIKINYRIGENLLEILDFQIKFTNLILKNTKCQFLR